MAVASPLTRSAGRHPAAAALGRLFASQEAVLLLCILLLFVTVGTYNPRFLSQNNLQSIFLATAT